MDYHEMIVQLGDHSPIVHACLDLERFHSLSWEETLSVMVLNLVKANDNLMERVQKLLTESTQPLIFKSPTTPA